MTSNSLIGPAPKFEKCVHHVVPQGWQRRFTAPGKAGPIYKDVITGVMRGPEGPGDKMSEEYVNIIFDDYFRPSDALENRLAKIEDRAFKALDRVIAAAQIESSDKVDLAYFIALQASRYPELYNDRLDLGRYT